MAGRTRQSTQDKTTEEEITPGYQVPPPMEDGDTRTVPQVGGDPDNPETDNALDDTLTDYSSPEPIGVSAFGVHMSNGSDRQEMEPTPDGWDRNADGSMTPNTVPWAGY